MNFFSYRLSGISSQVSAIRGLLRTLKKLKPTLFHQAGCLIRKAQS